MLAIVGRSSVEIVDAGEHVGGVPGVWNTNAVPTAVPGCGGLHRFCRGGRFLECPSAAKVNHVVSAGKEGHCGSQAGGCNGLLFHGRMLVCLGLAMFAWSFRSAPVGKYIQFFRQLRSISPCLIFSDIMPTPSLMRAFSFSVSLPILSGSSSRELTVRPRWF